MDLGIPIEIEPKEELTITWKPELIFISYVISVQSCYAAVLILQMRFTKYLIAVGSFCLSVSGIWSMHFTGMAAMEINTHVEYDIGWTVGSAFFAFALTTVAFFIVDSQVREQASADAPLTLESHINAMKKAPHLWIFASALLIATGVCTMHYTGMHAMQSDATAEKEWNIIIASVFIALFASVASLYFAFVLPITRRFTIPTALVMGVAVCGMHYTGMYGIKFYLEKSKQTNPSSSISDAVIYIICGSTTLSSAALALSSYLYRVNLRKAGVKANKFADMIIQGRYEVLTDNDIDSKDPIMSDIQEAFRDMGEQLQKLKSFLPQSLLAAYEGADDDSTSAGDEGTTIISFDGGSSIGGAGPTATRSRRFPLKDTSGSTKSRSSIELGPTADVEALSKRVTIMAFNLVGFHKLVNSRKFEEALVTQTQTLEALVVIAQQHKSIIDNYQGDRAIFTFNVVSSNPTHIKKAGLCAAEITKRISGIHKLQSTIGIASGTSITGVMGTATMRRHGVIGPSYTLACVLERMCKCYKDVSILISPECRIDMRIELKLQCVDYVCLPGKSKPCIISQILGLLHQSSDHEWMYALQGYERKAQDDTNIIFDLYSEGNTEAALEVAQNMELPQHIRTMLTQPPDVYASSSMGKFYSLSVLSSETESAFSTI
eukprot:TRINITY_DN8077_c0_g1_i1.p1 TRINITY_DN8077_c0_g1~~TRINITY_DN8077_c0_g1_i1.p1  ORF type:complete len:676 (+),score=80.32 TRINITY_DN8077_c0_g1_i1:45-2030(+)